MYTVIFILMDIHFSFFCKVQGFHWPENLCLCSINPCMFLHTELPQNTLWDTEKSNISHCFCHPLQVVLASIINGKTDDFWNVVWVDGCDICHESLHQRCFCPHKQQYFCGIPNFAFPVIQSCSARKYIHTCCQPFLHDDSSNVSGSLFSGTVDKQQWVISWHIFSCEGRVNLNP